MFSECSYDIIVMYMYHKLDQYNHNGICTFLAKIFKAAMKWAIKLEEKT